MYNSGISFLPERNAPNEKTFTHFAAFLLLLLLGCQAQPASEKASAPSEPAPVTETVSAAPLPQQEAPQLPDVCRLYYDYTKLAYIVPAASDLPLSAEAKRGAPDVLGLWYQGEFTDISQEGFSVSELTEGKPQKPEITAASAGTDSGTTASMCRPQTVISPI